MINLLYNGASGLLVLFWFFASQKCQAELAKGPLGKIRVSGPRKNLSSNKLLQKQSLGKNAWTDNGTKTGNRRVFRFL